MARRIARALLCLALVGGLAIVARADEPSAAVRAKVKRDLKRGRAAYNAGKLDDAVRDYQSAYRLYPVPDIQFNIGQIERVAGHREKAIAAYHQYLTDAPDGDHASDVEAQIVALTRELVPAELQPKFDAVKARFADYQKDRGHDLDDKWSAITASVAGGDTLNLGAALDDLSAELDARTRPQKPLEARAGAEKVVVGTRAAPPAAREQKPRHKTRWFWNAIGGGAALLITGIAVGAAVGSHTVDPVPTIGVLK